MADFPNLRGKISSKPIFKGKGQWSTGQGNPVGHFDLPVIAASSEVLESDQGFVNGFLVIIRLSNGSCGI